MKTYGRVQNGVVAELLKTDGDIASMFNPALVWVDVSSHPDVAEGWGFDGTNLTPPRAPPATPPVPTVTELRAQLAIISAQLAALSSAKS
jgi:hypothetical protein